MVWHYPEESRNGAISAPHVTSAWRTAVIGCQSWTVDISPPTFQNSNLRERRQRWSKLLHFAWVVDDAKCIVFTRICVCLSVCLQLHAYTIARTRMYLGGVIGNTPSCALLDEFAIGARVVLQWQHNANPSYKLVSTLRYDNLVRTRNVSECSVLSK